MIGKRQRARIALQTEREALAAINGDFPRDAERSGPHVASGAADARAGDESGEGREKTNLIDDIWCFTVLSSGASGLCSRADL